MVLLCEPITIGPSALPMFCCLISCHLQLFDALVRALPPERCDGWLQVHVEAWLPVVADASNHADEYTKESSGVDSEVITRAIAKLAAAKELL